MEKKETLAGDIFQELEEIEKLNSDKEENVRSFTHDWGPILTLACC